MLALCRPSSKARTLYRPLGLGGLGLISVRHKAKACFLRNFLELCANPNFIPSLRLSVFFRAHVLQEEIVCPPLPPYLSPELFEIMRTALNEGHNVGLMSTRQWYWYLLSKEFSKDESSEPSLSKVETENPESDWKIIWNKFSLNCLDGLASSLAF